MREYQIVLLEKEDPNNQYQGQVNRAVFRDGSWIVIGDSENVQSADDVGIVKAFQRAKEEFLDALKIP